MSFIEFWAAYPRHDAKKDAEKAWAKLNPPPELIRLMLVALDWQRERLDWLKEDGRYIPLPATWLRGARWEDERSDGNDCCAQCGGLRRLHCGLDEPGLDHPVGCALYHHEFRLKAARSWDDWYERCQHVPKCGSAGIHDVAERIDQNRKATPA